MFRYSYLNGWRALLRISSQVQASSSSAPAAAGVQHPTPCSGSPDKVSEEPLNKPSSDVKPETLPTDTSSSTPVSEVAQKKNTMVAAAFASLKDVEPIKKKKQSHFLDERISSANSVESLLAVAETPQISRRHALRIVSQLADWTTNGKVKLSDFEADARFVKLCRLLGRGLPRGSNGLEKEATGFGDLAVVLGITGDDEAAKLVAGISLSQMIRIMSSLAQKQRRSTPLLRSLAFNMARQTEKLNIKDCADLLYAMAVLNFPDELLLEKACGDLCECVESNKKPAVIGSILTSLGLLRYKHTGTLDMLAEWVAKNIDLCRPQELTSLLLTLASVILPHVTSQDAPTPAAWLDIVWALIVLEQVTPKHVTSVLDPEFHSKLLVNNNAENLGISVASKLKLLNINAAAQLNLPGYKGPLLSPDSDVRNVPLVRSRDKQLLVASILDSFSNLLPSATYLQTNINTGMGFLLDGECKLDSKCNPLPVATDGQKSAEGEKNTAGKKATPSSRTSMSQAGTRIGIVVWDYKDMCRGSPEPNGVSALSTRLLEKAGYKVLSIPYTEYNTRDKLVRRVQYLDRRLKALVKGS
ncbi:hypothetical protein C0J52_02817 [Blattella germanica]|nr:hypothetical protein C0J52_02817 [Blattella germanica]